LKTRYIVCPVIRNKEGEYLICKMPKTRGVYPGQWAIPGGGIEPGETMFEALHREIREEVGENLKIIETVPWCFADATRDKLYPEGHSEQVYMIFLIFDCLAFNTEVVLNDEFEEYVWVLPENLRSYDLNDATRKTFEQKGFL
jgi:nucleoside triphosphatase